MGNDITITLEHAEMYMPEKLEEMCKKSNKRYIKYMGFKIINPYYQENKDAKDSIRKSLN